MFASLPLNVFPILFTVKLIILWWLKYVPGLQFLVPQIYPLI